MSGYVFPVLGGGRITSDFGIRSRPTAGASTNHGGVDIGGKVGTPILATTGGNILFAGNAGNAGNMVKIMGDDGYIYQYMHLQNIGVQQGATVGAGSQIGTLGATGNVTGPHLHFGVIDPATNTKVDPKRILGMSKDTIKSAATIIDHATEATKFIPGIGTAIGAVGDAIGAFLGKNGDGEGSETGGDDCFLNPICYLRKWFEESGFVRRIAIAALGVIFVIGAVYLLKSGILNEVSKSAKNLV